MYIAKVPNRSSPPAILLREGYREGGKVKSRTLANLSRWPEDKVEALRVILKAPPGQALAQLKTDSAQRMELGLEVARTRPHGHVAAVVGMIYRLGLEKLIDPAPSRRRSLALALVA
ncbi:MAG: IS1634 family transposase, partial [Actinomycetota bacterium]